MSENVGSWDGSTLNNQPLIYWISELAEKIMSSINEELFDCDEKIYAKILGGRSTFDKTMVALCIVVTIVVLAASIHFVFLQYKHESIQTALPPLPEYRPSPRLQGVAPLQATPTRPPLAAAPLIYDEVYEDSNLYADVDYEDMAQAPSVMFLLLDKVRELEEALPVGRGLNESSLVGVALLAADSVLLHALHRLAWKDKASLRTRMMREPDALAFSAIFMTPRQLTESEHEERPGGVLDHLLEAALDSARGLLRLGRVYQEARKRKSGRELECIWQLYCRNARAAARLPQPYDFLARLNGVSLQAIHGKSLMKDMLNGGNDIPCSTILPRCNESPATAVLESIMRLQNEQA